MAQTIKEPVLQRGLPHLIRLPSAFRKRFTVRDGREPDNSVTVTKDTVRVTYTWRLSDVEQR